MMPYVISLMWKFRRKYLQIHIVGQEINYVGKATTTSQLFKNEAFKNEASNNIIMNFTKCMDIYIAF